MKISIPQIDRKLDCNGRSSCKKHSSHGSFRANRKPNSKRVRNGQVKPASE